jgi:hypothetical protein
MLGSIDSPDGRRFAHDPLARGYHVVYRENEVNHCPGCGRTHWYIGRLSAECGFCGTALPLAETTMQGTHTIARIRWPSPPASIL